MYSVHVPSLNATLIVTNHVYGVHVPTPNNTLILTNYVVSIYVILAYECVFLHECIISKVTVSSNGYITVTAYIANIHTHHG